MTKKLQFGVLGCARIVRRAIVGGLRHSRLGALAAIASRTPGTAAAWAREFDIPRHYDSYHGLLADPHIDAVYIPLPNELHHEWALKAAAAGKHVLCEKPLGLDLADAEAIAAGCRRSGVMLMEAFMWRHHPRVAHARRMLADGQLGELRLVKMDFSFNIDRSDWRLDPTRGGGALYDLGCYGINAARLFAGAEPEEIVARANLYSTGVDMTVAIQLRFLGGVFALLDCSFECPHRNRLEIVGTRGAIEFPGGIQPPEDTELLFRTDAGVERIPFVGGDHYAEEFDAFATGIANGRLPEPAEDGVANMAVVDAVRRMIW